VHGMAGNGKAMGKRLTPWAAFWNLLLLFFRLDDDWLVPNYATKGSYPFIADDGRFLLVWCGYLHETWLRRIWGEKSDLDRARKYKMKYSSAEDIAFSSSKSICDCETLKLGVTAKCGALVALPLPHLKIPSSA
jgi:hypothetical protein